MIREAEFKYGAKALRLDMERSLEALMLAYPWCAIKVKYERICDGLRGKELEAIAITYEFKEFTDEGKK